jgi:hypothetical protein
MFYKFVCELAESAYIFVSVLAPVAYITPEMWSYDSAPDIKLDRRHTGRLRKRDNLLTGEGAGVEPYHTCASINQSILSGLHHPI